MCDVGVGVGDECEFECESDCGYVCGVCGVGVWVGECEVLGGDGEDG